MLDGVFRNPSTVFLGAEALTRAIEEIRSSSESVLCVCGVHSSRASGLLEKVVTGLASAGLKTSIHSGIPADPRQNDVNSGIEIARKANADFVLAIGGASVIDTSKAIALGMADGGDWTDFFTRKRVPHSSAPLGVILTVCGAGSETNDAAVITIDGHKYGTSHPVMFPVFAALDERITAGVSRYQTSCGVVDALSHVMERYFSQTSNVLTSTFLCEATMRALMTLGRRLVENPQDLEFRKEFMWAAKLAHDNTLGFGRKHDWASHTIAHEIGVRYHLPHGATLAIVFPAWMKFMASRHPSFLARWGREVWGVPEDWSESEQAKCAIDRYVQFLESMALHTNLRACLNQDVSCDFIDIARACCKTTVSGTIGNFHRLTQDEVVSILHSANQES
jgi:alcohol dehydrogenase YqhD (iron-dependent ADH family)